VGCSADSEFSHWKWLQTDRKEGGIREVSYPLVSDASKTIAENYDVLAGTYDYDEEGRATFTGLPRAYRGLFLIDRQGIVRHQIVNDMPLGRSTDEAIRMVDALQFYEDIGEVCPADWHKGEKGIRETQESIYAYLADIE
jgi:peroxiredoxin (alkyl hydroperoxide reductase subunit C)